MSTLCRPQPPPPHGSIQEAGTQSQKFITLAICARSNLINMYSEKCGKVTCDSQKTISMRRTHSQPLSKVLGLRGGCQGYVLVNDGLSRSVFIPFKATTQKSCELVGN